MRALDAALPPELAPALLDPTRPGPADLRAWNGSDPQRRLAVHRNNVVSGLVDALADSFQVVQELVGSEFFRAMAACFVRAAPPRSPLLFRYGAEFPDFVAGFPPAAGLPYLADVARLEWLRVQAYHAADAPCLPAAALERLATAGTGLDRLRLTPHPSLQAFDSPFAAVSIWAAHQGVGALEAVVIENAESALVFRQELEVLVLPAPPGSHEFVACLRAGMPLLGAWQAAADRRATFDFNALLGLLLSRGALSAIDWTS